MTKHFALKKKKVEFELTVLLPCADNMSKIAITPQNLMHTIVTKLRAQLGT
jgi:hypothetical protein